MNDADTVIVVLLLGDPRSLEGGEGGQSGGTLPNGKLAVMGGDDLDLRIGRGSLLEFFREAGSDAFIHSGTAREDNVLSQLTSSIQVGLIDRLLGQKMQRIARFAVQCWLEEKLRNLHAEGALDFKHALVWELVDLVEFGRTLCGGKLSLVVQSDEAKFFFNILDSLHLGAGGEGAARLKQKLLAVLSDEAASNFHLLNGVGNGETFEDGDGVGDTITGIND